MKDNVLYTPALETGILAGITRSWVIRKAKSLEINVVEGLFTPDKLEEADEVFVTNAIQELVPIHQLGMNRFDGKNGLIYMKLHERYMNHVEQTSKER